METRSLSDFLDHQFYERGAFLTEDETGKVYLGKGGHIQQVTSSESVENSFYLKDFFRDSFLVYKPDLVMETTLKELALHLSTQKFSAISVLGTENEDRLYALDFQNLMSSFGPALKKVVLVSRETFTLKEPREARKLFFSKSIHFGTGYPSGIWFDDYGIVGSTPELLFSIIGPELKTFALAGTAPKDQGAELLQSKKDRQEHDFVISDIVEKLSPFSDQVHVSATGLHPYRNIVHLKTDIKISCKEEMPVLKLAQLLSPTAALGGYPHQAALQFLSVSEYAKRHPNRTYGSAFGFKSATLNQAVVMIRNIQWQGESFVIESGGGVVNGSTLDRELEEIRLKRESIKGHYL